MSERLLLRIGWKFLPFLCLISTSCCLPDGDLCRWMNGRKYYIDVGESGIISAENVTSQTRPGFTNQTRPGSVDQPQIPQRCSVELVTCPSCHFRIHALHLNIPTCSADNSCRCDFLWIRESAYTKTGHEICGIYNSSLNSLTDLIFEAKTKQISIDFLYTGSYSSAFALHFSAIKNVYLFQGGYEFYRGNNTGFFNSPNFPGGYPNDYSAEYVLQNVDTNGFVQLLFTDFQLSLWSYIEILDSNGSRIDVYNGNTFRPPAIISSGPTLHLKFEANEEYPASGFRAAYTYVGYPEKYWLNRPSTDCGGFVEDDGGAITMLNMEPGNMMRIYDCVWLVKPRVSGPSEKQVSVRVAQFEEMGPKSTLTIRQGLHSTAPLLESVTTYQPNKIHRGQEYVVSAQVGFYIRLVGQFKNKSHLAIVYSAFEYEECYAVVDFECSNGRCIKSGLHCDGFNHCGDGSDESSCYGANQGTHSPEDVNWWRTLTPNYYFPKSDSANSAGTNTLILVTSLAGLGMFVLTTVVILFKLHKQRRDDSISREILQTITADIEAENAFHRHHGNASPPMYDPPPSYDDAIKFYLPPPPAYSRTGPSASRHHSRTSAETTTIRPQATRTRTRRHKMTNQAQSFQDQTVLQVVLPEVEARNVSVISTTDLLKSPESTTTSTFPQGIVKINVVSNPRISNRDCNFECECRGACCCSTHTKEIVIRSLSDDTSDTIESHGKINKDSSETPMSIKKDASVCSGGDARIFQRRTTSDPSIVCTFENVSNHCDKTSSPYSTDATVSVCDSENDNVSTGWGTLWNQMRSKSDAEERCKPEDGLPWTQSDTQPLISRVSFRVTPVQQAIHRNDSEDAT